MGMDHPAPNEPGGRDFDYGMKNNGGVIICVRAKKTDSTDTVEWMDAPPTGNARRGPILLFALAVVTVLALYFLTLAFE